MRASHSILNEGDALWYLFCFVKAIGAIMGRFKNPGGSQLPNHQIGAAVFDVEYIRNMTGAEFVFISIAAEQFGIHRKLRWRCDASIGQRYKEKRAVGVKYRLLRTLCVGDHNAVNTGS